MRRDEIVEWVTKLPPLPQSIQKLEQCFALSSSPEIQDVVSIIESDPALSADIMAFANSPLFSFSQKIHSIQQAVILFGMPQIRKMALKSAIFGSFKVDMGAYGITNEEFLKISSFQSDLVFRWYMGVDIDRSKTLLPIAFMLEAGSMVLSRYMIDNDFKEKFLHDLQKLDISEAEILHTNMSAIQVNYILFEYWKLDEIFSQTMHALDNELYKADPYIEELAVALKAVRMVINLKSQFEEESIESAGDFLNSKGLDGEKFVKTCNRLAEKF